MWWTALIGALLGTVKANQEAKKYQQQGELESVRSRWSPWTGREPRNIGTGPDTMGIIQQGASAGAMFGQDLSKWSKE